MPRPTEIAGRPAPARRRPRNAWGGQLESEGFAVAEKFKGVTVAERSTGIVVELMQFRRGLEVLAAQLAGQHKGALAHAGFVVGHPALSLISIFSNVAYPY